MQLSVSVSSVSSTELLFKVLARLEITLHTRIHPCIIIGRSQLSGSPHKLQPVKGHHA